MIGSWTHVHVYDSGDTNAKATTAWETFYKCLVIECTLTIAGGINRQGNWTNYHWIFMNRMDSYNFLYFSLNRKFHLIKREFSQTEKCAIMHLIAFAKRCGQPTPMAHIYRYTCTHICIPNTFRCKFRFGSTLTTFASLMLWIFYLDFGGFLCILGLCVSPCDRYNACKLSHCS